MDPSSTPEPHRPLAERAGPDLADGTVEALGLLSEALETVEHARGHLYAFHRLLGRADLALGDAVEALRSAGHAEHAHRLADELVGRNVLPGRWTFQLVEEFDDGYWAAFRRLEGDARRDLAGGRRHVLEARMKQSRRSPGRPSHRPEPPGNEPAP